MLALLLVTLLVMLGFLVHFHTHLTGELIDATPVQEANEISQRHSEREINTKFQRTPSTANAEEILTKADEFIRDHVSFKMFDNTASAKDQSELQQESTSDTHDSLKEIETGKEKNPPQVPRGLNFG